MLHCHLAPHSSPPHNPPFYIVYFRHLLSSLLPSTLNSLLYNLLNRMYCSKDQVSQGPFLFIAFREQAGYLSCVLLICLKIARRCQTFISTLTLLWLMDPLCRVVSGQVYPGTLTHLKLELPHEICLGSSKFTMHSSQEFIQDFQYPNRLYSLTISGFKEPVTYFHCGVCTLSTHCQQSRAHVP